MRLSCLRALPRSFWGGRRVPELCRSLCQRPARVPTEGGDTAGTPKPGGARERHRAEGDTPRGDTSGGDTSAWFRQTGDNESHSRYRHRPRGPLGGGDTFRGGTFGGATLGGDISRGGGTAGAAATSGRGDTFGGGTSGAATSGGDTFKDETSRGDTSGGDTFEGGTSRGDTFGGATSRGDTLKDGASRDDTSRGDTSRGGTSGGDTFRAEASRGDTFGGATSAGDTSGGSTSDPSPPRPSLRHLRRHTRHHPGDNDHDGDRDNDRDGTGAFRAALRAAERSPPARGGRLALVEAALAAMPALGVERSLSAYKALLRLLPRGPWVPRGPLQRLLFPFPRQQECGLRLLEQMERYGVIPDAEARFLLLGVFGPRSRPARKLQRLQFWLPRFRHLDPHPLPPGSLPPGLAAAQIGLRRMAGDPKATVTVVQRPVPETGEDEGSVQPFIVSWQGPEQQELLQQHDPSRPVFVEGPFPLWLRGTLLRYFVLRGDPLPPELRDPPPDPERSFYFPLHLELELERGPWDDDDFQVDEVEEGPVFALCVAGAGDRRTLARWISALQRQNPVLGTAPVVFRLSQTIGDPQEGPQTPQLSPGTPPGVALEPPEDGEPKGDPSPKRGGE